MNHRKIKSGMFGTLLLCIGVSGVFADVWIFGVVAPQKVSLSQAPGLIALIVARGGLNLGSCSYANIRRTENGAEIIRRIDTWAIIAKFSDDFPLKDGDVILVPEHMIGCLNHESYNRALQAYLRAKGKSNTAPPDWDEVLRSAGGSCGRASLRDAEKKGN